ncbi:LytTR family DNA-binding domain-containing protein [Candidatus Enterococcus courvalinii]|uniref:LytTR family transcriptional regulator DNA-binding domain-containing protein n=1 Tax=Candidatus Enterococcus courvalinii TaxID=2815329 RepID=A0ABS3HZ90_9ENTE|nr:LytTR family DNA-binding domain-containing protein [Enterococcus sp. MSG2901]MBO0481395.1 LytTR family transcriptional regulator DNA-binding domain-containing protein [Enterococcus sp. MSG2901]
MYKIGGRLVLNKATKRKMAMLNYLLTGPKTIQATAKHIHSSEKTVRRLLAILEDELPSEIKLEVLRSSVLILHVSDYFVFSIGSQTFTLDLEEVWFIETSDIPHRLILYVADGQYEFYGKLSELSDKYPTLFKINRSCLVNLNNVKEVNYKNRFVYFSPDLFRTFAIGKAKKIKEALASL